MNSPGHARIQVEFMLHLKKNNKEKPAYKSRSL